MAKAKSSGAAVRSDHRPDVSAPCPTGEVDRSLQGGGRFLLLGAQRAGAGRDVVVAKPLPQQLLGVLHDRRDHHPDRRQEGHGHHQGVAGVPGAGNHVRGEGQDQEEDPQCHRAALMEESQRGGDFRPGGAERLERRHQLLAGGEPLGGFLLQELIDHLGERDRKVGSLGQHRGRRLREVKGKETGGVGRVERGVPGDREVRHAAEGVEVAPAVESLPGGLLRAHEVRGADHFTDCGETAGGLGAGDPEIGDDRPAGGALEHDVVGLHVAMDDAATMGVRECPGHFLDHPCGVGRGEGAGPVDALGQRFAVDEAHDETEDLVAVLDSVHRYDVRMGKGGGRAGLAEKPLAKLRPDRVLRGQCLDGDLPVELGVVRQEDGAHPAPAQFPVEGVVGGKGSRELRGEIGHGGGGERGSESVRHRSAVQGDNRDLAYSSRFRGRPRCPPRSAGPPRSR